MKIGPGDVVHLAYRKASSQLRYGKKENGAWTLETIPVPGPNAGYHVNLALDSQGHPHLAYVYDDPDASVGRLGYARWNGAEWILETVPTNEINLSCALALDSNDRPHIIYRDKGAQTIRYVTRRDGAWIDELPYPKQTDDSAAHSGAIVIDSQDHPHLFFGVLHPTDANRRLVHVRRNGSGWESVVLEQSIEGFVGPAAAIDSSDTIRLAYMHAGFKYAVWTGGVWTKEAVLESEGGTKVSLAVDAGGLPHLLIANSNNSGWRAYARPTDVEAPAKVTGLAVNISSESIGLSWSANSEPDLAGYRVLRSTDENGPFTSIAAPTSAFYADSDLASGTTYFYSVRAVDVQSNAGERSDTVTAFFQGPVDASCLSAFIKSPQGGKKLRGNQVTIFADTACEDPSAIGHVRFEYRPAGGAWTLIVPANDQHPNPDTAAPFFVHWNVDALAEGGYEVRAVAGGGGREDSAPVATSLFVDQADPDLVEDKVSDDHSEKVERIHNDRPNVVVSGRDDGMVAVRIPAGALAGDNALLSVVLQGSVEKPLPRHLSLAGPAVDLTLSNDQHDLSATVKIEIPYQDDNGDGREDRTNRNVSTLSAWYFNEGSNAWERIASHVDASRKVVIGETDHFSLFALVSVVGGPGGTDFSGPAFCLGEVFCYPNPVKNKTTATIEIEVAPFDDADLFIYDVAGDLVHKADLKGLPMNDGRLRYVWDLSRVPSGNYVYRVLVKHQGSTANASGLIGVIK